MDLTITSQDYQDMKGREEKELVLLKDKITDLQKQTSPFKIYIQKEVLLLENLLEYYRKSVGITKMKLPGCNSDKKLKLKLRAQCKDDILWISDRRTSGQKV